MTSLIESFAGGVCFGLGAVVSLVLCSLFIRRNDKAAHETTRAHYKAVEERLTRQADAVVQIAMMMDEDRRK